MAKITPPLIDPEAPLSYVVRITGMRYTAKFMSLGMAARYAHKLTFAAQSQENVYIDEYLGTEPTGTWYRYDNKTLALIKNT